MGTEGEGIRETWEAVRQLPPKERSKALLVVLAEARQPRDKAFTQIPQLDL